MAITYSLPGTLPRRENSIDSTVRTYPIPWLPLSMIFPFCPRNLPGEAESTTFHLPSVYLTMGQSSQPDPTPRWGSVCCHVPHGTCFPVSQGRPNIFHDFSFFGTRNPPGGRGRIHQISPFQRGLTMSRSGHPRPDTKIWYCMSSRIPWHMFSYFLGSCWCFPWLSNFRYEEPTRGGRIHKISPTECVLDHGSIRPPWTQFQHEAHMPSRDCGTCFPIFGVVATFSMTFPFSLHEIHPGMQNPPDFTIRTFIWPWVTRSSMDLTPTLKDELPHVSHVQV
jgi:hypothetical protein